MATKDLGEPRDASCFLRRNNRAFGSHPYRTRATYTVGNSRAVYAKRDIDFIAA
ncbi:MAG: hypothetical protein WBX38_21885 [Candidatus Sulfotelmatobacter sp.]